MNGIYLFKAIVPINTNRELFQLLAAREGMLQVSEDWSCYPTQHVMEVHRMLMNLERESGDSPGLSKNSKLATDSHRSQATQQQASTTLCCTAGYTCHADNFR